MTRLIALIAAMYLSALSFACDTGAPEVGEGEGVPASSAADLATGGDAPAPGTTPTGTTPTQ